MKNHRTVFKDLYRAARKSLFKEDYVRGEGKKLLIKHCLMESGTLNGKECVTSFRVKIKVIYGMEWLEEVTLFEFVLSLCTLEFLSNFMHVHRCYQLICME